MLLRHEGGSAMGQGGPPGLFRVAGAAGAPRAQRACRAGGPRSRISLAGRGAEAGNRPIAPDPACSGRGSDRQAAHHVGMPAGEVATVPGGIPAGPSAARRQASVCQREGPWRGAGSGPAGRRAGRKRQGVRGMPAVAVVAAVAERKTVPRAACAAAREAIWPGRMMPRGATAGRAGCARAEAAADGWTGRVRRQVPPPVGRSPGAGAAPSLRRPKPSEPPPRGTESPTPVACRLLCRHSSGRRPAWRGPAAHPCADPYAGGEDGSNRAKPPHHATKPSAPRPLARRRHGRCSRARQSALRISINRLAVRAKIAASSPLPVHSASGSASRRGDQAAAMPSYRASTSSTNRRARSRVSGVKRGMPDKHQRVGVARQCQVIRRAKGGAGQSPRNVPAPHHARLRKGEDRARTPTVSVSASPFSHTGVGCGRPRPARALGRGIRRHMPHRDPGGAVAPMNPAPRRGGGAPATRASGWR